MRGNRAPTTDVLGGEELAAIARHGLARRYPAKAVIVAEGDRSDALYVILEGRVRASVGDGAGREAVLSEMGPGEYFGEVALDGGPRSATVVTLEPCLLSVVAREDLDAFIRANPAFAAHFIRRLLARIRDLTENVRSLALLDACGRVARLLMERSVTEGGVRHVPERLTQAAIASRVGCSREMVSRILKDLARDGCISMRSGRIVIHRAPRKG